MERTEAPPHRFDADTALEPTGERCRRAWAPDRWFVARGELIAQSRRLALAREAA